MKLIIHVGLHKTGSTFLQNTMYVNYDKLINDKLLFPKTGFVDLEQRFGEPGTSAGHDLFVKAALTHDNVFKKNLLSSLSMEIEKSNPDVVFMSAENLTNHMVGDISRNTYELIKNIAPVKILISLRNPYEWIESYYRDRVVSGWGFERLALSDFIRKNEFVLNYCQIIKNWEKTFGKDNVDIFIYGKKLKEKGLLNVYKNYLGIQEDLIDDNKMVNEGASDDFVRSSLIFNQKVLPTEAARRVLTEFKVKGYSKGFKSSFLSRDDMDFIEKKIALYNTGLKNQKFIVGSFDELLSKPASELKSEVRTDFSTEFFNRYKMIPKTSREMVVGILKYISGYMPIRIQVATRRLWVSFSINKYRV